MAENWEEEEERLAQQTGGINLNQQQQQPAAFVPGAASFTPGASAFVPGQAYNQYQQGGVGVDRAWAAALTLILIVMILNLAARLLARAFAPKGSR